MCAWEYKPQFRKTADAVSVPIADSTVGAAATAPLPELAVGNKPAPGLTGPKGLAPRTNYSRVNSGSPPPADLGSTSQKGLPTDPQGFLPPKVAHYEVPMTAMTQRYTIQDMIKAAAAGASSQVSVALEGTRQLANSGEKVASATALTPNGEESISTAYVEKLAAAVDYIIELSKEAEEPGPGTGPNPLQVLEAKASNNEIEAGHTGEATPAHLIPKNPGLQRPSGNAQGPANALDDNASSMLPAYPVKLSSADIECLRKAAAGNPEGHHIRREILGNPISSAIEAKKGKKLESAGKAWWHGAKEGLKGLGAGAAAGGAIGAGVGALKGGRAGAAQGAVHGSVRGAQIGGAVGALKGRHDTEASRIHGEHSKHKEASASDGRLVDYFLSMTKAAEDAINPAKISAGAAVPPETSASGESGGAPVGGQPQGPVGLIGSNDAAINFQKREAKAPVKTQMARILTEPALSAAHDHTLDQAFDNTGKAGVKISSSVRALSARAVLEKMAEEACATTPPKKKVGAGMGNFQAPPVGGVAGAAS